MVEWKKLGEVCEVLRGKRLTKSQLDDKDGYPVLHGGSTPMGYYPEYNRKANTTVVVNTGNAGSVFFYDKEFWSSDACFAIYPNESILDKFLYLYVCGCERILKGKIRAGAMPTIDSKAVEDLIIPIPSISEQSRIVSILDTFTASIDNLKQQIEQRRKQYEHYRDQLLDLEGKEGVKMKTLGEACEVITGGEVPDNTIKGQQAPTPEHPYAVYTNGKETYGYSDSYQIDADTVCISSIGANTGAIFYKTGKFTPAIRLKVLIPRMGVISKYLYYSAMGIDFKGRNTGSVPNINANYVKSKMVPIPSVAEQSRIVGILDTFEASIANLEQQLEMREKQYEYYRNKLLTFD